MHIIISRFSAIGDVAMTIPVVYGLAQANPSYRFTMLTKRGMTRIFVNPPRNLEVIGLDFKGSPLSDYRTLADAVDAVKDKGDGNDGRYFVDLHDVMRSRLLSLVCLLRGYKTLRFDKARKAKRDIIRHSPKAPREVSSNFIRYAAPFARIHGIKPAAAFRSIFPDGKGDKALFEHLTDHLRKGERRIGIAPFAAHEGKIYPPELMKQVIDLLAAKSDTRIYLFGGGRREAEILSGWAAGHGNVTSLAGSGLSLEAELSLMGHLDIMVTMDSANMHFASLVGTPTLSIWGATSPVTGFAPYQSPDSPRPNEYIQVDGLECRPCSVFGDKPCRIGGYPCLHHIQPSAVVSRIMELCPPANL